MSDGNYGVDNNRSNKEAQGMNTKASADIKATNNDEKFNKKSAFKRFSLFIAACLRKIFFFTKWFIDIFNGLKTKLYELLGKVSGKFKSNENIVTYNQPLHATNVFPGILTGIIVIVLSILLTWVTIQAFFKWISFGYIELPDIPIIFGKKTTQMIYSVFFVITSIYLIFYLTLDYLPRIKDELDVIQIFKQLIGSLYILWPIAVIVVGSIIAKAFYKMSCGQNKPNLLNFAKIVESSLLFLLGIAVLIMVILLIRPIKWILLKIPGLCNIIEKLKSYTAIIIKFIVIYILLRLITLIIEDLGSDKLIFYISILNKKIESPPVDCNIQQDKKKSTKDAFMEKAYNYIIGALVCLLIIFIIVLQVPHPFMTITKRIDFTIGLVLKNLTVRITNLVSTNNFATERCYSFGSGNKSGNKSGMFSNMKSKFLGIMGDKAGALTNMTGKLGDMKSKFSGIMGDKAGALGDIKSKMTGIMGDKVGNNAGMASMLGNIAGNNQGAITNNVGNNQMQPNMTNQMQPNMTNQMQPWMANTAVNMGNQMQPMMANPAVMMANPIAMMGNQMQPMMANSTAMMGNQMQPMMGNQMQSNMGNPSANMANQMQSMMANQMPGMASNMASMAPNIANMASMAPNMASMAPKGMLSNSGQGSAVPSFGEIRGQLGKGISNAIKEKTINKTGLGSAMKAAQTPIAVARTIEAPKAAPRPSKK